MHRVMKAHDPDLRKEGNNGTSYLLVSCIDPVWKDDVGEVDKRGPRCSGFTAQPFWGGGACSFNLL